jgi:hypothetical protein
MKKKVLLFSILFFVFGFILSAQAVTSDLYLSFVGGQRWISGKVDDFDYQTKWQPFGLQESCDFFIKDFFIGIHQEMGIDGTTNKKDFKRIGMYKFAGGKIDGSYTNVDFSWFFNIGPVFSFKPVNRLVLNITPMIGNDWGMFFTSRLSKYEDDFFNQLVLSLDAAARVRFNRFIIVGGIKASYAPFMVATTRSSEVTISDMNVKVYSNFAIQGHIGAGIEIGKRR